jgi:modulator of FtsH protease HflC
MKRNALTLVVGVILLIIFVLLLFTFQVRQTEVVVLTTFAKPSTEPIQEPGLYFKWPVPIQRVYRFDKRIHNFEDEFEQMLTRDGHSLMANVYVGWTIRKPREFFNSFPAGKPEAAVPQLISLVRSTKGIVIGQHNFSDFVSNNPNQGNFTKIEQEMLNTIRQAALTKYGVEIEFLGIKRIGLPANVTEKVFDRMKAERQREVERLRAEGEKESISIRSAADRDRNGILAKAQAEAITLRGEADAQISKHFDTFKQNPDLAVFLMELEALERTLSKGGTIIADPQTSPFNLLRRTATKPVESMNSQSRREPALSASEPTNNQPARP